MGERSFADDPLRTLRMARFACELGFEVEPATERARARGPRRASTRVAPERSFYELRRLVSSDDPLRGLELMDGDGAAGRSCCRSWTR